MATMRDILFEKSSSRIFSVESAATVLDAVHRMNEYGVGALVVMDEGRMVGLFTERDVLRRVVGANRDAATMLVSDAMTTDVVCGSPETTVEEARVVMKNHRIRHLPVVDGEGNILGLASIGDLNAHHVQAQETTIHYLHEYVLGRT